MHDAPGGGQPVRYRGGGFRPGTLIWVGVATLAAVLLMLEIAGALGWIQSFVFPRPSAIAVTLWERAFPGLEILGDAKALDRWYTRTSLWPHLFSSLYRLIIGWGLGTILGLSAGLAAGMFTWPRSMVLPVVAALFPVPKIALFSLFMIWFGLGDGSKIATVAFGTFFPTVIATYGAVDNIPRTLIQMGQSFNLSPWSVARKIILPGALPGILTGMRTSTSIAIILLVSSEMILGFTGLGTEIADAGSEARTEKLMAYVIILSMMGVAIHAGLGAVERRLLHWR